MFPFVAHLSSRALDFLTGNKHTPLGPRFSLLVKERANPSHKGDHSVEVAILLEAFSRLRKDDWPHGESPDWPHGESPQPTTASSFSTSAPTHGILGPTSLFPHKTELK